MSEQPSPPPPATATAVDTPAPAPAPALRSLELGAGDNPIPGMTVYHDQTRAVGPHITSVHDLNLLPWPWPDNSWDLIFAASVMEHLDLNDWDWLAECWRLLVPGGKLALRLPAWNNSLSYRDPTHRRVYHLERFQYWQPGDHRHERWGKHYRELAQYGRWWHVVSASVGPDRDLEFVLVKLDGAGAVPEPEPPRP